MAEWRALPGWPYFVSDEGQIRHARRKVPVRPGLDRDGYEKITLSNRGVLKSAKVHQLVALAFLGPKPSPRHVVAHWDGSRRNNTPANLRWCLPKDNSADRERHGTVPRGLRHGKAKYSDEAIAAVRASSATTDDAARLFGMTPSYVRRVRRGEIRLTGVTREGYEEWAQASAE